MSRSVKVDASRGNTDRRDEVRGSSAGEKRQQPLLVFVACACRGL
jgi:hypothetical protein